MCRDDVYPVRTFTVGCLLHYVIAYLGLLHSVIAYLGKKNLAYLGLNRLLYSAVGNRSWTSLLDTHHPDP
jgi:hypothetical protein